MTGTDLLLLLFAAVCLGWKARQEWGMYKVRREFRRIAERRRAREVLEKDRNSTGNGWSS